MNCICDFKYNLVYFPDYNQYGVSRQFRILFGLIPIEKADYLDVISCVERWWDNNSIYITDCMTTRENAEKHLKNIEEAKNYLNTKKLKVVTIKDESSLR